MPPTTSDTTVRDTRTACVTARSPGAPASSSVADALDAITSGRPYKAALTVDEARRQIEKDIGTHFDPAVVDAFLQVPVTEWREISEHSSDPPHRRDASTEPLSIAQRR